MGQQNELIGVWCDCSGDTFQPFPSYFSGSDSDTDGVCDSYAIRAPHGERYLQRPIAHGRKSMIGLTGSVMPPAGRGLTPAKGRDETKSMEGR